MADSCGSRNTHQENHATKPRSRLPKRKGELAELAFMHKAASLGFGVAKPYGDSERYDFILDTGKRLWRVQVKSTSAKRFRAYQMNTRRNDNGRMSPYGPSEIDFLVAHVVPEDAWYVIPVQMLGQRKLVTFYPRSDERTNEFSQYHEAWGLMRGQ
jgi:hypothetical protein